MDTHVYNTSMTMDQIQSMQGFNSLSPKLLKSGHFLKTNYNFNVTTQLKIVNGTAVQDSNLQNNIMVQNDEGDLAEVHQRNVKRETECVGNQDTETRGGCPVKREMLEDDGATPVHSLVVPESHCGTTGPPSGHLKPVNTETLMCDKSSESPVPECLVTGVFSCYRCRDSFTSGRALRRHGKVCGGESRGCHACLRCPYTCQSASVLKIHERVHSGEKPYACKLCDYKSGQKNNVAKHALVHLQEKPHRCRFCDYSAAQKNNLVVHERTHTGIKPYKCTHCDYRTVQKPNLDKHMYLHTDRKPFVCDRCPYRCVQKANLVKHRRRHNEQAANDEQATNDEQAANKHTVRQ